MNTQFGETRQGLTMHEEDIMGWQSGCDAMVNKENKILFKNI
jgi:hypothetical protein